MASMDLFPAQLFAAFPEPVLLLQHRRVRYCNPAAERLFPGLAAGEAAPEALSALLLDLRTPTVLLAPVVGLYFRVSIQETDAGLLLFLRPDPEHPAPVRGDRLAFQLRQQAAGLSAAIQQLAPGRVADEDKRAQYLSLANQRLYRLLRLVDHIEFSGRDIDGLYRPAALDLAGLCSELAEGMEDVCHGTGYRFSYESALGSLPTVGDDALLRRLLLALLSNAMKAAGAGGAFGLRLARLGTRAVLTVWDGGPGVDEGGMAALFGGEAAEPPRLSASEGLGLGLPAVRRVAELHGGTVMLESRPGDGLRAVVSLPVHPPERGMPLRSGPRCNAADPFSDLLVEFSDLLPAELYGPEE